MVKYEGVSPGILPTNQSKEEKMSENELSPEERARRGKRLLVYGMFSLILVTVVAVFLVVWLLTAPVTGSAGVALQTALIVGIVAIVACVIVWFVYTKAILKE